jgi:hypothetical protein
MNQFLADDSSPEWMEQFSECAPEKMNGAN